MSSFSSGANLADAAQPQSIELQLRDLSQLFNRMDPSPLREKDLHAEVEEFIVSSAREYPSDAGLKLRIHLEQWPAEEPTNLIEQAVQHYFAYRTKLNQQEFRRLMKRGRTSLAIGLVFLSACLAAGRLLFGSATGTWAGVAREGLTIAGWVAMWRPMEIYLYDWWPLRNQGRIYARLSQMRVEVIQRTKSL